MTRTTENTIGGAIVFAIGVLLLWGIACLGVWIDNYRNSMPVAVSVDGSIVFSGPSWQVRTVSTGATTEVVIESLRIGCIRVPQRRYVSNRVTITSPTELQ